MSGADDMLRYLRVATNAANECEGITADNADVRKCCDVLKLLEEYEVTTQLLQDTKAGKTVRKLMKHANPRIKKAAGTVVDFWKESIRKQSASEGASLKAAEAGSKGAVKQEKASVPERKPAEKPDTSSQGKANQNVPMPRGRRYDSGDLDRPKRPPFKEPPKLGVTARDSIRTSFANALKSAIQDDYEEVENPYELAAAAESAIYAKFDTDIGDKYKQKVRSVLFNLRDKKNPDLRRRVVIGELPATHLVDMTAEELASDNKKAENDAIRTQMRKETERSNQPAGNVTDMFKCAKCKQRRCSYYQMQTRSADEPMTTFVQCLECGNRWKFC